MSEIYGMEIWLWGGFPVMAEITRNHTFTKQISHATSRGQYFDENFYCKNCLLVFLSITRKQAVRSLITMAKDDKYSFYHDEKYIVRETYIGRKLISTSQSSRKSCRKRKL